MEEDQGKEEGKQRSEEEEEMDDSDAWAKINETMNANMAAFPSGWVWGFFIATI